MSWAARPSALGLGPVIELFALTWAGALRNALTAPGALRPRFFTPGAQMRGNCYIAPSVDGIM
jgi:hypothetical protein